VRTDEAAAFTTLEALSPWGEQLLFKIESPKKGLPIELTRYHFVKVRCVREGCNRLYSITERDNRLYCSQKCYVIAKRLRAKIRAVLKK